MLTTLQKNPSLSHVHHVQALGLEGNNGKAAPFFGVNGDVLQVSVKKLPCVCMGVGRGILITVKTRALIEYCNAFFLLDVVSSLP